MKLPGGLLLNGKLLNDVTFKPITGEIERAVFENCTQFTGLVDQVTAILTHAVDRIVGMVVNEALVLSLSSGDRHFLIQQLEALLKPYPKWLTTHCDECQELIQIQLQPGSMPVKPANDRFPKTSIILSIGSVETRVPTGADEHIISNQPGNQKTLLNLLLKRIISQTGKTVDIEKLTDNDRKIIDETLEEMMPQVGDAITTLCPYCDHEQLIKIDTYEWISGSAFDLDEEIHTIASHYHWSEKEILSLSRYRRKRYLEFINTHIHHTEKLTTFSSGEIR